jgi:tetratricopeptide (TPR) repeat protein
VFVVVLVGAAARRANASDAAMATPDRPEPAQTHAALPAGGNTPFDNALRLARMLGDEQTIANLLEQRALGPGSTWPDIVEAVDALEVVGESERAARLLERRAREAPLDPRGLEALADLWTRNGRVTRAIAAWRRLAALGPLGAKQALAFATALDETGQRDEALRVLVDAKEHATADAVGLWDALATLAWQSDDDGDALLAYRKLWSSGDRRPSVAERLMTLAGEAGAYDEAVAVGTEGYAKSGDADLLLDVASLETSKQDWAGVLRTLGQAGADRVAGPRRRDALTMRAEAYEHLQQWQAARAAYEAALALDPSAVSIQAALLELAIARDDRGALRDYAERWSPAAANEPELWEPLAVALDRIGRTREALAFFAREARDAHADPGTLLDFADALARSGQELWSWRLRRRAAVLTRDRVFASMRGAKVDTDDRAAAENIAEVVRDVSGPDAGERWVRAVERVGARNDARSDAFAASWCLQDDQIECARRVVARHLGVHTAAGADDDHEPEPWRGFALEIALAEDDRAEIEDLLVDPSGLDPGDRIDALLTLERDRAAAAAIGDATRAGIEDAREEGWHRRLVEIEERHAPSVGAAAAYDYVDGLGVYGPDVTAAHDAGAARILYTAGARELAVQDGSLLQSGGAAAEFDGFMLARFGDPRGFEEAGAGVSYQTGTPLPKASLVGERLLRGGLGVSWHLGFDEPILDTGLLRLAAAQSIAEVGARYDLGRLAYAEVDLHAREDHTRRFHHVANEAEEVVEAGVKVLGHEPEWDVGLQALASQRQNVGVLPDDLAPLVPAADRNGDLSAYLPPSFQLVALVTHLTRGDFFERYRPDRASFPRYDCSAAAGLLLPDLDAALEIQCAASVRVAALAHVSATASLERGFLGVADQTNAETRISFTQSF